MSGIYFHIPFCKVKCNYCDFFKSTDLSYKNSLLRAIEMELVMRKDYLADRKIGTIYFGGGTPSILQSEDLSALLNLVYSSFEVIAGAEITFEANPDDLTPEYLDMLIALGINRLSIGIQSFSDDNLKFMGRRHNAKQTENAVYNAQKAGFNNISVDLIYGIPGMSFLQWKMNLDKVFSLNIQHLSAYHLTYHENTPFWSNLKRGLFSEIDEDDSLLQYEELISQAEEHGFFQYEISNFSPEGFHSKHNSSYWKQVEYLGLGPSAHSYNQKTRHWNLSDIKSYIAAVQNGIIPGEFEVLTVADRYNDYLMTGLRTIWGIDKDFVLENFGNNLLHHLNDNIQRLLLSGLIEEKNNQLFITKNGIFISDKIISELFYL